jgi:hypothetical protein
LDAGATFNGKVILHNLRKVELGAILWCLTWGQDTDLLHSLGMAKPFGYGLVSITIGSIDLRPNRRDAPVPKAAELMEAFTTYMDGHLQPFGQTWVATTQIRNLTAMANPLHPRPTSLAYPVLDPTNHIDDFKAARSANQVLPRYDRTPNFSAVDVVDALIGQIGGGASNEAVIHALQLLPAHARDRLPDIEQALQGRDRALRRLGLSTLWNTFEETRTRLGV